MSTPFVLLSRGRRTLISPGDALLRGCKRLIAGRNVTIHAVVDAVEHGRPHLYRDSPREHGMTAIQITAGVCRASHA